MRKKIKHINNKFLFKINKNLVSNNLNQVNQK